ncbi:mariner Mos1 transposase [Trichonephila clavipes]|nr:mariner Mos1 transposase [Trichonephila clavipes]
MGNSVCQVQTKEFFASFVDKKIDFDNPKKRTLKGTTWSSFKSRIFLETHVAHLQIWVFVSQIAAPVKAFLETLSGEVIPHPSYLPFDYFLFQSIAYGLSQQHFTLYENTKNLVDSWIASKDETFFRHSIRILPESIGG